MIIIYYLFQAINLLILARVIVSWVRPDPHNPIVQFIYQTTEPMLAPIRQFMPATGGIDFSPLILLLILNLIQSMLLGL